MPEVRVRLPLAVPFLLALPPPGMDGCGGIYRQMERAEGARGVGHSTGPIFPFKKNVQVSLYQLRGVYLF